MWSIGIASRCIVLVERSSEQADRFSAQQAEIGKDHVRSAFSAADRPDCFDLFVRACHVTQLTPPVVTRSA